MKENQSFNGGGCGVVSDHRYYEDYNVAGVNCAAFLCHGTELEILGNIFFDLESNFTINIRLFATSIGQMGFQECRYLNDIDKLRAYLTTKETPSFKSYGKKERDKNRWWNKSSRI